MRSQLIRLMRNYRARVRITYLETDWQTLLNRNGKRSAPIPVEVLQNMARKFEVPSDVEAYQVNHEINRTD